MGHIIIIKLCTEDLSHDSCLWTSIWLGKYLYKVLIILNYKFTTTSGQGISLCNEDLTHDPCLLTGSLWGDYLFTKLDTKLDLQICNYRWVGCASLILSSLPFWQIWDYSFNLKFVDNTAVLQLGQISWSVWDEKLFQASLIFASKAKGNRTHQLIL